MGQIKVTLPDGTNREFQQGTTFLAIAESIGRRLAKTSLAAKMDDQKILDMSRPLTEESKLTFISPETEDGLEIIRHSTAHVLAMAVQKIWPGTKVTIGPVIEDGFYYDFDFPEDVKISDKDLGKIEQEMRKILKKSHKMNRKTLSRNEAIASFENLNENYKVEIIQDLPENEEVTIYEMGGWFDLCRGPHVPKLSFLGAFKLTHVAGAYWRGSEKNKMLSRIYGTAWATQAELEQHLNRLKEAKKRDHRVLGKQLDLFSFHGEAPAHAFFHEKGTILYQELMSYMRRSNERYGFKEVTTPLMMNVDLWHKSGHFENYSENMYFVSRDGEEVAIKPMNCPGHCLIFGTRKRSYRELPIKLAEFGRVHRHEKSGVVNGLFRVRSFVQDDAHIFCAEEDILTNVSSVIQQIRETYEGLGFKKYHMELSTRPEKSIGSDEIWQAAEQALEQVLQDAGVDYKLNPGDGAFYGPKIDFHLVDAIGRSWQCGTVQLDFSMPERFDLEYVSSQNNTVRPVMIHRAVLGSLERFMGIFIENYAGHFPLWAAPVQALIINITKSQEEYAKKVQNDLVRAGVRCNVDLRNEKLGYKIREAQLQKTPYMIVIGDKELEHQTISPRFHDGTQHDAMSVEGFIQLIKSELHKN